MPSFHPAYIDTFYGKVRVDPFKRQLIVEVFGEPCLHITLSPDVFNHTLAEFRQDTHTYEVSGINTMMKNMLEQRLRYFYTDDERTLGIWCLTHDITYRFVETGGLVIEEKDRSDTGYIPTDATLEDVSQLLNDFTHHRDPITLISKKNTRSKS